MESSDFGFGEGVREVTKGSELDRGDLFWDWYSHKGHAGYWVVEDNQIS